jgi:putative membrane protein
LRPKNNSNPINNRSVKELTRNSLARTSLIDPGVLLVYNYLKQDIKNMPQFIITWIITAVSLLITAYFVPGIKIDTVTAAAIGAIVLGLINAIVKPIMILLTLPLTILTLGLFLFVINALSFYLVAYLTPGFHISTFWAALLGSIVLSLVSSILSIFFGRDK